MASLILVDKTGSSFLFSPGAYITPLRNLFCSITRLAVAILCLLGHTAFSAPDIDENDLYGMWMSTQGPDTLLYDYNQDGKLILFKGRAGQDCKVLDVYRFKLSGNKIRFSYSAHEEYDSTVTITQLNSESLQQVHQEEGKSSGSALLLQRVHGHPCDLATANDIHPLQRASASEFYKSFSTLLLFYALFIFGSFVLVISNLFNPGFIFPFLKKWIGATLFGSLILYSSAYGFYDDPNNDVIFVEGYVNHAYNLFFPYKVSYGEGNITKSSVDFWYHTMLAISVFMSFPTVAWYVWEKNIKPSSWAARRMIGFVKKTYSGIMLLCFTGVFISSVFSPSGPTNWVILIFSFVYFFKLLKGMFVAAAVEAVAEAKPGVLRKIISAFRASP